ncbi:hypothetical protein HK097_006968 [Rhizophlyctis rosea]|uniref:DJ-1/PfpI domain-containing protein n=1 Tax=Rhizophlyctis rosea TaxID=64517 RepID=A0AAD5SCA7_9FUNG|nr:hypothetical protein HK097_006968 [Rhizophlyctis rosea]
MGPLQLLNSNHLQSHLTLHLLAQTLSPVPFHSKTFPATIQPSLTPTHTFSSHPPLNVLLVPGGMGTRTEVHNKTLMSFLSSFSTTPNIQILSVCTGSLLLAHAGLLQNRRATTNKLRFSEIMDLTKDCENITWVKQARWVKDGNVVTASGVAAGMDMTMGMLKEWVGEELAFKVAQDIEFEPQWDSERDPFAAIHGLA